MNQEHEHGLKRSHLSGYLNTLIALLLILTIASATCPYTSGFGKVVCNCPNGQTETYTSNEQFQEARKDPSSCCYYKPTTNQPNPIKEIEVNDFDFDTKYPLTPTVVNDEPPTIVLTAADRDELQKRNTNTPPPTLSVTKLLPNKHTELVEVPHVPNVVTTNSGVVIKASIPDYEEYSSYHLSQLKLFGFQYQ